MRDQIGFAGLINQLGNFAHGAVHRQIFQALVDDQAEDQPKDAEENPEQQQLVAVDAKKVHLRKIGKL